MDVRKLACLGAAGFLGTMVVAVATSSPVSAKPNQGRDLLVTAERVDPSLQRRVSYRDLNLVFPAAQKELRGRVSRTANNLCFEINDSRDDHWQCRTFAYRDARPQIAAAIERAKLGMAGKSVGPDVAISLMIIGR